MTDAKTKDEWPEAYEGESIEDYAERVSEWAEQRRLRSAAPPQPADVPHDVVRALEDLAKAADRYHDATAHYFSDGDYDADGQLADTSAELTVIALPQALDALATPAPSTSTEEALRAEKPTVSEADRKRIIARTEDRNTCDDAAARVAELEAALREIAESDDIDNALDPTRNKRLAIHTLTHLRRHP